MKWIPNTSLLTCLLAIAAIIFTTGSYAFRVQDQDRRLERIEAVLANAPNQREVIETKIAALQQTITRLEAQLTETQQQIQGLRRDLMFYFANGRRPPNDPARPRRSSP